MPKDRDRRGGQNEPVLLIPELCFMCGLTDEQRSNFRLMQDLSVHTRQAPEARIRNLQAMANRITTAPKCIEELTSWGMEIDPRLVKIQGRRLPSEKIGLGRGETITDERADWTRGKWLLLVALFCPCFLIWTHFPIQVFSFFSLKFFLLREWKTIFLPFLNFCLVLVWNLNYFFLLSSDCYNKPKFGGLFRPHPIERWVFICPERDMQICTQFYQSMSAGAIGLNLNVKDPKFFPIADSRTASYIAKIKEVVAMNPNMVSVKFDGLFLCPIFCYRKSRKIYGIW
jgi:hypothetical protein